MAELHLYDFDGTLFRSPQRPDWWGKDSWIMSPESLGPPCVPLKPGRDWWIGKTVQAAKQSIGDRDTWAILCTGRPPQSAHRLRVGPEQLKSDRALRVIKVGQPKRFTAAPDKAIGADHPGPDRGGAHFQTDSPIRPH